MSARTNTPQLAFVVAFAIAVLGPAVPTVFFIGSGVSLEDFLQFSVASAIPYVAVGSLAAGYPDRRAGLLTVCMMAAGSVGLAALRTLLMIGATPTPGGEGCMSELGFVLGLIVSFGLELGVAATAAMIGRASIDPDEALPDGGGATS